MPAPLSALTTLRPDLSGAMEEVDVDQMMSGFVARKILPTIDVAEPKGSYGIIPKEQLLKLAPNIKRASRGAYARDDMAFKDTTYETVEYGFETPVDEKEKNVYRHYFDSELMAARNSRWKVMAAFEQEVCSYLTNTANFGNAVGSLWTDHVNATPLEDVEAQKEAIWEATGFEANTLVMGWKAFNNARRTEQVTSALQAQGAGSQALARNITLAVLATVFDVEQVIVAKSMYDASNESNDPNATGTMTQFWTPGTVLVCRSVADPNIKVPTLGRSLHWSVDGSMPEGVVEEYEEPQIRSQVIRCRRHIGYKIHYSALGRLITGVI